MSFTVTTMWMMGFAASPGAEVEPMCSTPIRRPESIMDPSSGATDQLWWIDGPFLTEALDVSQ